MEDNTQNKELSKKPIKLKEVFDATLRHWPWIVVSLFVCIGIAIFFILKSNATYTGNASVVIRDEEGGSSSSSELSGLSDFGLLTSNTNIYDEVNKFKSPDVFAEVVDRLNLDVTYWTDGTLRDNILYGPKVPIKINLPAELDDRGLSCRVTIKSPDTFKLTDLVITNGKDKYEGKSGTFRFGQAINTPMGHITVDKAPTFAYGAPDSPGSIKIEKNSKENATNALAASVDVTFKKNEGNTINFAITDLSPRRAEDILNTMIDVYNERWIKAKNEVTLSTTNFIDQRLAVLVKELGNVDQDISSYQSANMIPDVKEAASLYMQESQQNENDILQVNNQLQMTRYMRDFVAHDAKKNQVIPANTGIENPGIEEQISEYNKKAIERSQLAANSSDNHPVVIDMDAQLSEMRSSIIQSLDNQVKALGSSMRNLQANQGHTNAQISATPTQAQHLLSAERQQKVKESLYLFLLQKREENQLSQAFSAYNTEVIAKPKASNNPTGPHRMRILGAALLLGLVIPFGAEYVKQLTNDKIRTRKDLSKMKAPLLGELPMYKFPKGDKDHTEVVVKQGERDLINESFRLLRTNIRFVSGEHEGCEVLMLTSFIPGSGKTFIAMNLGATFALKQKRTLVIDCDMRRAATSAFVNTPGRGISDYLVGRVKNIEDVIVANKIQDNLSVLPVGTIPPNPTELLESEKFTKLIESLRKDYDIIIIDCPPTEMMADAQIIDEVCDRTIFVVRSGHLNLSMVDEIDELFREKKFKNMGVVLNATPIGSTGYGSYGKSYGYGGYGYGYGYGDKKN